MNNFTNKHSKLKKLIKIFCLIICILLFSIRNLWPSPLTCKLKLETFKILSWVISKNSHGEIHKKNPEKIVHFFSIYSLELNNGYNSKITLCLEDQTWKTFIFYENTPFIVIFIMDLFVNPHESICI